MKRVIRLWLLFVLGSSGGCAAGQQPLANRSELAGRWRCEPASDLITEQLPTSEPLYVTITADGTFDLSETYAGLYGDATRLRRPGDEVVSPVAPHPGLRVIWSAYSARNSILVAEGFQKDAPRNSTGVVFLHASLGDERTALFTIGTLPASEDEKVGIRRYRLTQATGQTGDTSPREALDLSVEEVVVSGVGSQKLTCCVLKPRGLTRNPPAVVWLGLSEDSDSCESLVRRWQPCVQHLGFVLLIPRLRTAGWISIEPPSDELHERAREVLDCVVETRRKSDVGDIFLYAESVGGFLGHYLWQTHNEEFSACLTWDSRFPSRSLSASVQLAPKQPIYLIGRPNAFKLTQEEQARAAEWYRARGTKSVIVELLDMPTPTERDEWLVRKLLGRT